MGMPFFIFHYHVSCEKLVLTEKIEQILLKTALEAYGDHPAKRQEIHTFRGNLMLDIWCLMLETMCDFLCHSREQPVIPAKAGIH